MSYATREKFFARVIDFRPCYNKDGTLAWRPIWLIISMFVITICDYCRMFGIAFLEWKVFGAVAARE